MTAIGTFLWLAHGVEIVGARETKGRGRRTEEVEERLSGICAYKGRD